MPRKKKPTEMPTAILVADLHVREDQPICRTDDYFSAQGFKMEFLRRVQIDNNMAPVIMAGDVFNNWKPSPFLLSWTLDHLPLGKSYAIYGQHDLPQHNMNLLNKSGLNVLDSAQRVTVLKEDTILPLEEGSIELYGFSYGSDIPKVKRKRGVKKVAVCHFLTYSKEKPFPGFTSDDANRVLRKMSGFDLIVVGDNHKNFVIQDDEGRLLVSTGSMMRSDADQVDHRPRVYLWYAKTMKIEPVYFPIEDGVVSREHIDSKEERDTRIDAFVKRLKDDWSVGLDFDKNMEAFLKKNKVKKEIVDAIWEAME